MHSDPCKTTRYITTTLPTMRKDKEVKEF